MKISKIFLISFMIISNLYTFDWSFVDGKLEEDKNRYQISVKFFEGTCIAGAKERKECEIFLNQGFSNFQDIENAILKEHPELKDYQYRLLAQFKEGILDINNYEFSQLVENPFHVIFSKQKSKL